MIDAALSQIVWQLNQYLRRTLVVEEDFAILSNVVDQDGSPVPIVANKLVIFLAGVERELNAYGNRETIRGSSGSEIRKSEPIFLNLLVMCAANLGGATYVEALKLLSCAIAFFQVNTILDHHNCPELDSRVERLSLEIENLSLDQLHNLWGIHSGRYLPSVLYRVRMVAIDPGYVVARMPTVRQIEARARE
jgi:Pvc16 N-terminal domain